MRTTLTLDDDLARNLKERAHRSGRSFKNVVNQTLRAGLAAEQMPPKKRYRVKPVALGGVLSGIDLDKALQIVDALEDQEIIDKLYSDQGRPNNK